MGGTTSSRVCWWLVRCRSPASASCSTTRHCRGAGGWPKLLTYPLTLCRATKSSPNLLKAFETPSVPAWINLNVKITALPDLQRRDDTPPPPLVTLEAFPTVLSCAIYPGITGSVLAAQIHSMPTCKAVIVSAFGSGNLPIKEETGVLQALEAAVKREILVVVISTCGCMSRTLLTPTRPRTQHLPPVRARRAPALRRRVARLRHDARGGVCQVDLARVPQGFELQAKAGAVADADRGRDDHLSGGQLSAGHFLGRYGTAPNTL